MWQTIGHKNQKLYLEKAIKDNKFSHAYLFSGPESIGKKTLAIEFAKKILGLPEAQKFDPDLIIIEGDKLKIEDLRNLMSELSLKPYSHLLKVAVIDNFENATDEAANSILKTLEEPNSSTIIILITKNKKQLLPTIVSRAQPLSFNRLTAEEIDEAVKAHKNFDRNLLAKVNGKLGKYFILQSDKSAMDDFLSDESAWKKIKAEKAELRLAGIKQFSEKDGEKLQKTFENWLDQEYANFLANPSGFGNIQLLLDSILGLRQNFNKKMILEKLFLNLF